MMSILRRIAVTTWLLRMAAASALVCGTAQRAHAQLDDRCTVSVLNRTVHVNADGSWDLPNVPAGPDQVKARATCVVNGQTKSGESDLFTVVPNDSNIPSEIAFGPTTTIPTSLTLTPATPRLTSAGQTLALQVQANYPDGSTKDVTAAGTGTNYTTSNPAIVRVDTGGILTAVASGTALIQATNDGASGLIAVTVVLSSADSDGDGIPDDVEIAMGLNPNDPIDALEDPDRDGLTNAQEIARGTDPRKADTDGDGLSDGDEVARGTNPLLRDTDGDGISDGLEVATGSNPLDSNSYNLSAALQAIDVTPAKFTLAFNTLFGDASQQLVVTGHLRDGTTIDLTSTSRGTNYVSSDIRVCNFSATPGQVFAGVSGTCTITITIGGFTATSNGTVTTLAPQGVSFVNIPGYANNVDVKGNFAYVAAGPRGLVVVDVTDRRMPQVVASLALAGGNAEDVRISGTLAYVANGFAGLAIVDVSNPRSPQPVGSVDTPGNAQDVAVAGPLAFVADGDPGLQVIDVSNPASPRIVGSVDTPGVAKGVVVAGTLAIVADGPNGVEVVDVSVPAAPAVVGHVGLPGDARDVTVNGTLAYVAAYTGSLQIVSFATPIAPVVLGSTPSSSGGILTDVKVRGRFAFGADVVFVNGVPITDVSNPAGPVSQGLIDFSTIRDDNGTGIAIDDNFVYLTAARDVVENGTSDSVDGTRLYIGQYRALEDHAGIPPVVSIAAPAPGASFAGSETIPITVSATDDVAVVQVNLFINGTLMASDTSAPYQFTLIAPTIPGTLTIGATAVDVGGNAAAAQDVVVNIISNNTDPLTTVVATIVDVNGNPLPGAILTVIGNRSGTSGPDGTVTIPSVSTVLGPIQGTAAFTANDGLTISGTSSPVAPVRAGTTNLGNIVVGAFTYYAYNPNDQGTLKLSGWTNNTHYRIVSLDAPGGEVANGTIGRYGYTTVPMTGVRHFKLETTAPLQATIGYSPCCQRGGSFFYPTIDGTSFVGRKFIIRAPNLSLSNQLVVIPYQLASFTITDPGDDETPPRVVYSRTGADPGDWELFDGRTFSVLPNKTYIVEATGDIAIESTTLQGTTSVPSANGHEVGTSFLYRPRAGDTGTAIAFFAYENATITTRNISTGGSFVRTLAPGQFAFVTAVPDRTYWTTSTGKIAVWAGATRKFSNYNDPPIIDNLGNLTVNVGNFGLDTIVHSENQGAYLFATRGNTLVNVGGRVSTLNAGDFIDIAPSQLVRVFADKPVVIETIGGDAGTLLDSDWETALKLVTDLPASADHDGDGIPDTVEVRFGFSPLSTDTDGNGVNDAQEDLDHDGISTADEIARGLDPANPDTDGDGLPDGMDDDPLTPERIPPVVGVRTPVQGSTLFEGQTLTVAVDATDNARVRSVNLLVNGAVFGTASAAPYEFTFTVPYGLTSLTFSATARDYAGNSATAPTVAASVSADVPATIVRGRVVGSNGAGIAGALVSLKPNGLKAEIFNFDTHLAAMPDLTGRVPDVTRHVSAINFRNTGNVLTTDTFGTALAPDYAARFTGFVRIPVTGAYRFVLGVDDWARLSIDGVPIVEAYGPTFNEAVSSPVTLHAGTLPIGVEYFQTNDAAELQLSYIGPDGIRRVVPSSMLFGPDGDTVTGSTLDDGTFSVSGVPALGSISAVVTASAGPEDLFGSVYGVTPVIGGVTDLGQITLTPPEFETRIGTRLDPCDFCQVGVSLPFAFPFWMSSHTDATLLTHNGQLRFLNGQLRVFSVPTADDATDATAGVYVNNQLPGRFVITWLKQLDANTSTGSKTFQLTLFADGRIRFGYKGVASPYNGLTVAVIPDDAFSVPLVDFSAAPLSFDQGIAPYEFFSDSRPFDLDPGFLYFTPNATGGYDIRFVPAKVGE